MYVLINAPTGRYVAAPGSRNAFTRDIAKAQTYATHEVAKANACGDETPVPVYSRLQRPQGK